MIKKACPPSGWTCDACHVKFHDDEPDSRQKRKLETHVTDAKHPCTQQPRARATRASQAAMGAPQALKPSLLPVSRTIASLQSRDGWTLTKPPAVQLRETWTKRLDARQSWVFVCRKAFDPTSAKEWFKDPANKPKVFPNGPWETADGGRAQYLWAVDGRYGAGPCDDFYKSVHNYLHDHGECREYTYAQVCADCLIVQVCDCVCCCR